MSCKNSDMDYYTLYLYFIEKKDESVCTSCAIIRYSEMIEIKGESVSHNNYQENGLSMQEMRGILLYSRENSNTEKVRDRFLKNQSELDLLKQSKTFPGMNLSISESVMGTGKNEEALDGRSDGRLEIRWIMKIVYSIPPSLSARHLTIETWCMQVCF